MSATAMKITQRPVPMHYVETPLLSGLGPANWSTCTELVPDPVIIHDGNFYYRALGFAWPFLGITRAMLRDAYQERGGQDSEFMTYAFKRLWDTDYRRWYSRLELGDADIDEYFWTRVRLAAAQEAARRSVEQRRIVTKSEVLDSWGIAHGDHEPIEPVGDGERPMGDSPPGEELSGTPDTVRRPWAWGYYRWRTDCSEIERLERWQVLLLAAARRVGLRTHLCTGFVGQVFQEVITGRLGDHYVIFLREDVSPTEELATEAVATVMMLLTCDRS